MALSPGPYFQYPGTWLPIHQQGKPRGVCRLNLSKMTAKISPVSHSFLQCRLNINKLIH